MILTDTSETAIPEGRGTVATVGEISSIITALETIPQLDPITQIPRLEQQRAIIRQWVKVMRNRNVTAGLLAETQVLPHLEKFCHVDEKAMRKDRGCDDWHYEECEILRRKWLRGDYSCDPHRGFRYSISLDQNGIEVSRRLVLDKTWEHYRDAKYYGEGELVNGQKGYSRLELMRDGIHAARIAGISGTLARGAYSVVMGWHNVRAKKFYADVDGLETIWYMGTAQKNDKFDWETTNVKEHIANNIEIVAPVNDDEPEEQSSDGEIVEEDEVAQFGANDHDEEDDREFRTGPTRCTRILMKSLETGQPVRVIRSFRLAPIAMNKPNTAFRYDGLYRVVQKRLMKQRGHIWSFKMRRVHGQGQLRKNVLRELAGTAHLPVAQRQGVSTHRSRL